MSSVLKGLIVLQSALGVFAAHELVATADDIASLRKWEGRVSQQLLQNHDSDAPECVAWLTETCGVDGVNSQCQIFIEQSHQRFGQFRNVTVNESVVDAYSTLLGTFRAERLALQQKNFQLRQLISFLTEADNVKTEPFLDIEVRDQVQRAKGVAEKGDEKIQLFVGKRGVPALLCGKFVKPLAMSAEQREAESNPIDDHGVQMLPQALNAETHYWRHADTVLLHQYADRHVLAIAAWIYVPSMFNFMVPCSNSGPVQPAPSSTYSKPFFCSPRPGYNALANPSCAGSHSCMVDVMPCSSMFGRHSPAASLASPFPMIYKNANFGSKYYRSSPYGSLSCFPRPVREGSSWILSLPCPNRQLENRNFCGSHPSGCSNLWGGPDVQGVFLAAESSVYDSRISELLYQLGQANMSFTRATFFTTSLTQLSVFGYRPKTPAFQHQGVQLTMPSAEMMPPKGSLHGDRRSTRVLTLEMMSDGLLSTFRRRELEPTEVHSMEIYDFDRIRPEVIANYMFDQKGMTYKDVNCHAFAQNLMERILAHGQTVEGLAVRFEPRRVSRVLGVDPELDARGICLLAMMLGILIASMTFQWLSLWRVGQYFWSAPDETKLGKMRHASGKLNDDLQALNGWAARMLGERFAKVASVAFVISVPPVCCYVVAQACVGKVAKSGVPQKFESYLANLRGKIVSEPLLAKNPQ